MIPKKGQTEYQLKVSDEKAIAEIKDVLKKYREKDRRFYYSELEGKTSWKYWIESRLDLIDQVFGDLRDELIEVCRDEGEPFLVRKFATVNEFEVLKNELDDLKTVMDNLGFPTIVDSLNNPQGTSLVERFWRD